MSIKAKHRKTFLRYNMSVATDILFLHRERRGGHDGLLLQLRFLVDKTTLPLKILGIGGILIRGTVAHGCHGPRAIRRHSLFLLKYQCIVAVCYSVLRIGVTVSKPSDDITFLF